MKDVVYYGLLKPNETVTAEHYRQQLECLNDNSSIEVLSINDNLMQKHQLHQIAKK